MTFWLRICALALALPGTAAAETTHPLTCEGREPGWQLDVLGEDNARLQFGGRDIRFTIPQKSDAEGRDWPKAMTLMARNDTAILVLDQTVCMLGDDQFPLSLQILTQHSEVPILLSGCCTVAE